MGDWQPMETAPRDGTRILVSDGRECDMARWVDKIDPHWDKPMRWNSGQDGRWTSWVFPSLWIPLPKLPNEERS